jgi:succinate dehydrogenase / fumarate reductase, membrane anchor subunit
MTTGPLDQRTIATPTTHYGSPKASTEAFRWQRITAILNVAFLAFLIWLVVTLARADHAAVIATLRNPLVWIPLILLLINVPIHMRIGMREIIEDYVHDPRLNRFSLMLNTFFALVVGLLGILAVLKIVVWG